MIIEAFGSKTDTVNIRIDRIDQQHRNTTIDVRIQMHRNGIIIPEAEMNNYLSVLIGSKEEKKDFKF